LDLVELQLRIAEGEPLPSSARQARISGHAIEVRLYAEDVPAGFVPTTGTLHRFAFPPAPGIRVDTGFRDGSVVSPHYDAMLAKVIAHGRTRADAARQLARALGRAAIHGVTTNRDLLVAILREPEFLAGGTDTYVDASDGSTALSETPRFGDPAKLAPAGSLLAPMPGLVLRVLAEPGAVVTAGQPILVLEAMKMEQIVSAPADGVLAELRAKAGEQVSTGQVLAVLETGEQ